MKKKKEKKLPKKNLNEYVLSSDAEAILYGLMMVLSSLIGFLNYGVAGEALTYIFSYIFGIFYIFVYLLFIFLGLYLMITKSMYKIRIDIKILGFILMVVGFCIAASMGQNLTINTFFQAYSNRVAATQNSIFSMSSTDAIFANLGGGIIGFLLTGALNSAISETGTSIVVLSFVVVGLILLFKDIVIIVVKWIVNFVTRRKLLHTEALKEKEKNAVIKTLEEKGLNTNDESKNIDIQEGPQRESASAAIKMLYEEEPEIEEIEDNEYHDFEEIREPKKENDIEIKEVDDPISNAEFSSYSLERNDIKPVINETKEEVIFENNDSNTYIYPNIDLLKDRFNKDESERKEALAKERLNKINDCLHNLGIGANAISYTIGPSVTRFDIKVNDNVKTNVLSSIENDLAVRIGGNKTVRLETIVEGRDTSGIEVGNDICDTVSFKECMSVLNEDMTERLLFPLGKDISGNVVSGKLDDMPHLLVCGTTGSGKSVFIHNIITSIIMRNRPDQLKLMLIDPKKIEFTKYNNLPHLLCPIITDIDRGKIALMRLVDEMERRYDLFAEKGMGASNYKEYLETCEEMGYEKIPYIVVVCDEFADFMSEGDKEIAKLIQRIAQKARACGIHMVIATQRPSVKVITGEIKANIPSRIALSVSSSLESRIIIDEVGAENLMGRGDLLARIPSHKSLIRVQSAYIDNKEIYSVCEHIKSQAEVKYDPNFEDLTVKIPSPFASSVSPDSLNNSFRDYHQDEYFEFAKQFIIETGKCSATKLQNHFKIGFSRADGILDTLEKDGVIKREGNKRVLADKYRVGTYTDDGEE